MTNVERLPLPFRLFMSHGLPIPECFNDVLTRALAAEPEYVWLVEEDMGLNADTLAEYLYLIETADIVAADYPVSADYLCARFRPSGELDYTGTGCVLFRPDVLGNLLPFTDDVDYYVNSDEPRRAGKAGRYGRHDVHMYKQAHAMGYRLALSPRRLWQYRVTELGQPQTNQGGHRIERLQDQCTHR